MSLLDGGPQTHKLNQSIILKGSVQIHENYENDETEKNAFKVNFGDDPVQGADSGSLPSPLRNRRS